MFLCLALAFAAPAAQANPDIWVKSKIIYRLQNESVVGLALEWQFDRYFSSRTIDTVDADGDGVFSESEAARLRQEIFDPLSESHYHLHVLSDGAPRDFSVATFEPGIENERLLFRFAVEFGPPVPYTREALVVSQFDERIVFDFAFMEQGFLLVEGPLAAGCKFRIGRGKGPLKGHDKTIALICEDQ
ncbi:DUF1007 family protein [Pelagibius sp.]|uniref:DUF1007 family protein n=1 Tax=Pelagibius sp. TaxID=1931238 RepID=UPI00262E8948|nr:DUF1007 family protein [Pelagibius sp.]